MSFYIGNDGTRIKRIRVWILNEQINRWQLLVDKNHTGTKHTGAKITPLRCYKDRGSRALRYGPMEYGFTPESCAEATKGYKWELVYKRSFKNKSKALSYEYKLKKDRVKRIDLINGFDKKKY